MSFLKDESFSTVSVEIAPMLKNTPATDPELFFFLTYLLNFERLCCAASLVINHILIAVNGFMNSQAEEKAKCELLGSSGTPRYLQDPEGELQHSLPKSKPLI